MPELDEKKRADEFQRKLEEIRQKTLTDELVRLEAFAASQVSDLVAARRSEEDAQFQQRLREAGERRTAAETALRSIESEAATKLTATIQKRLESRRREEAELRKKSEEEARVKAETELRKRDEEQRRSQEAVRKKSDEEIRIKAEAEQRKRKEEERQRAEGERRKKEEEQRKAHEIEQKRRQEEERLRLEQEARRKAEEELHRQQEEQRKAEEAEQLKREEEARRQEQLAEEARAREQKEREDRIKSHLARAKSFHREQNFRDATVEVAKVLMNDPTNAEAIALDAQIKVDEAAPREPAADAKPVKSAGAKKSAARAKKSARVPVLLIAVIVAGALLIGGIIFFQLKKSVFPSTANIAVLPWSGNPSLADENVIGASLAELVVRQFERSQQANVIGYPSTYGLARHSQDPSHAAFGLGSTVVLKGSIERSGEAFSVRLQLVDSTGKTTWEKAYARSADALATLPAEVADDVREVLHIRESSGTASARTVTGGAAYVLFLRALELLHHPGLADLQSASVLLDQATAQEANFGDALSAKAEAIALSYEHGSPLPGRSLDDAKNFSAEAIALDPSQAEGYIARGMVYDELKQYKMALQQFDNALQRAPKSSRASYLKAKVHLKLGQHQQGMDALTAAFRINPRDPAILTLIGQTYQLARATQEGFWYHEMALYFVADSTAYLAGPVADAILTDASLSLSQSDRVAAALQRILTADPRDYKSMYRLARVYQGAGKGMEALTLLNSAEKVIKEEIQSHPQNADAAAYLALTLTRSGQFPEALVLNQRILAANPNDAEIKYRIAQSYSLQMYSGKTMSVDEDIKKLCVATLREALALDYRVDEIANGDFYNMYEHSDFRSIIQLPLK